MKPLKLTSFVATIMIGASSHTALAYDFCQVVSDRVSEALHAVKSGVDATHVDLGTGVFNTVVSSYINDFVKENGKNFDEDIIDMNEEYVYQSCVEMVPGILNGKSKG